MVFSLSRALPIGRNLFSSASTTNLFLRSFLQTATLTTNHRPIPPKSSAAPDPTKPPPRVRNANLKNPNKEVPLIKTLTSPPTLTPEELALLPYVIRRTPFGQLPIYRKWMNGGTRERIHIKKINGDKLQLVKDLTEKFDIDAERIRINPVTGNIEMTGDFFRKTTNYLLERGF